MQRQPIPRRASRPAPTTRATTHAVPPTVDEISDDDRLYQTMFNGTSAIRYTTEGHPVLQQGSRRYILHTEPPRRAARQLPPPRIVGYLPAPVERPTRSRHWLVIFGTGMIVMILLMIGFSWVGNAWQQHQLDATYGMPRTYQTDAVVGHNGDSAAHPSHFTFENLNGKIIITELPAGDPSKAIVYTGPPIIGDHAESVPVTGSFQDRNGDGRPDMIVQVMNQQFVYLNTGTKFVSGQAS